MEPSGHRMKYVRDRTTDRQNTARMHRAPELVPAGLYDELKEGDRVTFLLGPDKRGTGTVVQKIVRASSARAHAHAPAPLGETSAHFPEYLIELDGDTSGRTIELTGAALAKLP